MVLEDYTLIASTVGAVAVAWVVGSYFINKVRELKAKKHFKG